MSRTLATLVVAVTVVLAGCSGAGGPTTAATTTDGTTTDGTVADGTAQLAFYVSDRPGAIGDFEHLNVTITRIGLHHTGSTNNTTASGTATNTTSTAASTTEAKSAERSGDGRWVERNVNDTTVDLTELQGENASLLENLSVPAGTYDKVFAYVSDVNGTLTSGESVNVKLPSQKLHVNSEFTLNASGSAHFVYDINVVKAGNSGKYIITPVVSETGINKPIMPVQMHADCDCGDRGGLNASFVGNVTRGENVTVKVTKNGSALSNATVVTNGQVVNETGVNGTVTFTAPDAKKLKVVVKKGDMRTKLKVKFNGQCGHCGGR